MFNIGPELAWAAGFFDGEGSIVVQKPKWKGVNGIYIYKTPRLSVVQCGDYGKEILERFNAVFNNLGTIYGPRLEKHYKPRYDIHFQGLELSQLVSAMMWKYLSGYKKEQIKNVLTECAIWEKTKPFTHFKGGAGHRKKG